MNAADKKRFDELEQRVKQLEAARPYWPVFVVAPPSYPTYPPPYHPWWGGTTTGSPTVTCDGATITSCGTYVLSEHVGESRGM